MNNKLTGIIVIVLVIVIALVLCFFVFNSKEENNSHNSNNTNNKEVQDNNTSSSLNDGNSNNDNNNNEGDIIDNMKMYISVNGKTLTATLSNNSSVSALVEILNDGDITIDMNDYANMEKVGSLGFSLPTNDESIDTTAGDLILYQGNSFVIYYDYNSWNLTRLGKIDNITQSELKDILGSGSVKVTLSLTE